MRALVLAIALIATPSHGQDTAIGFKSVNLGATQAEYLKAFPDHRCTSARYCTYDREADCVRKTAGPISGAVCNVRNTWAGINPSKIVASFHDGGLEMVLVTFKPEDFDQIVSSAKERWGAADSTSTEQLQTRTGGTLRNEIANWKRDDTVLMLRKYARRIDEGNAMITNMAATNRARERSEAAPKAGAKDM